MQIPSLEDSYVGYGAYLAIVVSARLSPLLQDCFTTLEELTVLLHTAFYISLDRNEPRSDRKSVFLPLRVRMDNYGGPERATDQLIRMAHQCYFPKRTHRTVVL